MTLRRALVLLPALLAAMLLAAVAASADELVFSDTAGTAHESAVAALVEENVVRGCTDDRFCSGDELTRGQAASMLVRALDLPMVEEGPTGRFQDTNDSVHRRAIQTLAEEGLVAGCADDRFCPHSPLTREQLATILVHAFEVPPAPTDVTYFDDLGATHGDAVRALAEAGVSSGCGDRPTSFCSSSTVTRAHGAMFLARAMDLVDRVELAPFEDRERELEAILQEAREAKEAEEAALTPHQQKAERAVEVALAQIDKPYRWGGSGPGSFDCSGLTSFAWAAADVNLPRSSRMQYNATTRISRSQLQPGDLVFYHSPVSHVAMYIGDGRVVEAPNSGNNVRIRNDGLTRSGVVGYGRPKS